MNQVDPELAESSRARSGKQHTIGHEEANRHGGNKFNRWSAIGCFSIFSVASHLKDAALLFIQDYKRLRIAGVRKTTENRIEQNCSHDE